MYVRMYVCVYLCMYVQIYIFPNIHSYTTSYISRLGYTFRHITGHNLAFSFSSHSIEFASSVSKMVFSLSKYVMFLIQTILHITPIVYLCK